MCDNQINKNAFETIAVSILNWDLLEIIKLDNNKFHCPEIHSLFLILMGKESQFITSLENVTDTSWRDFYITKTFISVLEFASHHTGNRVSHFTSAISKLTSLNLNSTCIDKPFDDINLELTVGAAKCFSNFTNIMNLDLSGIIIGKETADVLCRVFDFSKLQSLRLNDCKLTSKCITQILGVLKYANIQNLEIKNNSVDENFTKALVIAVLHWSPLCTIAFQENPFSHKFHGIFQIVTKFLKCTQEASPFSCNLEDTSSFITLLECMKDVSVKHSPSLKNLSKAKDLYFHYSDKIYFCINHHDVQGESTEIKAHTQLKLSSDASEIFQRFVNLTKMSIIGIKMNENIADNLLTAFDKNTETLQCIILNCCSINSKTANRFASQLQSAKNITEFQLCNNLIDDGATTAIVIAMLTWKCLSIMKMDNNHFSSKSMNLFAFVSKKYFTWYPDRSNAIDYNHEDAISMLTLLDVIKDVSTEESELVKSITCVSRVALNCLSDEQKITNRASSFFKRFTKLKELNLTGITIDIKVMDIMANAFVSNLYGTLESLSITSCHLDSVSVAKLLSSLNKKSIRTLDLSNNKINNEATEAINEFLNGNTTLLCINLASNYLKTEIIFRIKESILSCTSLQHFDISNNQITDDAAKDLIYLMCRLKLFFKLDGNRLSDDTLKQLYPSV